MKEEFDYAQAIEELEAIALKVEDPQTGIGDIDKYMKRSQELIEACRAYLRGAREALDNGTFEEFRAEYSEKLNRKI